MKNCNIKYIAALLMKITFYIILAIVVCGFAVKILLNQPSLNIAKDQGLVDIIKNAATFNSNGLLAMAAYLSAIFPFVFSMVICLQYILEKNLKGMGVWMGVSTALLLAFLCGSF